MPSPAHFIQQHPRHIGIAVRRHNMRRKQFQLLSIALLVEDLNRLLPARLRLTVQLAQIAECSLARTIRRAHCFHQRPVRMRLPVLAAAVRTKIHAARIVPRRQVDFKRVSLHYIAFSEATVEPTAVATRRRAK